MSDPVDDGLRAYTLATARLLGIDLAADEIDPVVEQVARVAGLVELLDRVDDDAVTAAPRFRPAPLADGR